MRRVRARAQDGPSKYRYSRRSWRPRVPRNLLHRPIPAEEELLAVQLAEERAEAAAATETEALRSIRSSGSDFSLEQQPPEMNDLTSLQCAFMREHRRQLDLDLGSAKLTPVPLSADVWR